MRRDVLVMLLGALTVALVDQGTVSIALHVMDQSPVASTGEPFIPVSGYVPFAVSLVIWVWLLFYVGSQKTILPLVLMGGGVLSNIASYIRYGVVVDYLPGIAGLRTNSADAMILLGITFLLLSLPGLQRLRRP